MAHFRIEAEFDQAARAFYAEIFYPAQSTVPLVRTKAKFPSKDDALNATMVLIGQAFDKPGKLFGALTAD